MPASPRASSRAFTLVELLIAIGIIALLISIVIASMSGVRAAANRAESVNALRQLMRSYSSYSTDHNQQLLPGYIDSSLLAVNGGPLDIEAKGPSGRVLGADDTSGWVWRLAPYFDHAWKAVMADYRSKQMVAALETEFSQDQFGPGTVNPANGELGIGLVPSFGLNSILLGGDSFHGGPAVANLHPWQTPPPANQLAVTQMAQVKNPARLIVFAATRQAHEASLPVNPQVSLEFGYVELRAPFTEFDSGTGTWINNQWYIDNTGTVVDAGGSLNFTGPTGVPHGRWGENNIPLVNMDGSTEVADRFDISPLESPTPEATVRVMQRWSPLATGIR